MPTYLVSNRPPTDYRPSSEAAAAWNEWFDSLGPHLVDRGNPTLAPEALGAPAGRTKLGGYTLVDADDLDHALALAAGCPAVRAGGGAEVGELTIVNRGTAAVAGETDGHGPRHVVVHETYLHATADAVWAALTDPAHTAVWWAHHNVSELAGRLHLGEPAGRRLADVAGTVVEAERPTRLVLTWANPEDGTAAAGADVPSIGLVRDPSRVTFDLQPYRDVVRLAVTHDHVASGAERAALVAGWAAVLSNLKNYLETGHALPTPPWDVLRGFVRT